MISLSSIFGTLHRNRFINIVTISSKSNLDNISISAAYTNSYISNTASVYCYTGNRNYSIRRRDIQRDRKSNNLTFSMSVFDPPKSPKFDYLLIVDFEATCDKNSIPTPQEIIEFPCLLLNTRTNKIEAKFHSYVQPQYHPQLSVFCTELTGIIQSMVDDQPHFSEVLQDFHQWMSLQGLLKADVKKAFVTCGDWDLNLLPKQCATIDLIPKPYFNQWINIKKTFADSTGVFPSSMMDMLARLDIKHVGRHHSGYDDCRNIANIAIELLKRGSIFRENGFVKKAKQV